MSIIEINRNPTRRQLNQFGLIWLVFFTGLGVVARFKWDRPDSSLIFWAIALLVPAIGWSVPRVMRWVFLGMSYLAWPIGFVVSHVVLAVVYFGVLTPIGLAARILGHDPMRRRATTGPKRGKARSGWIERPESERDARRYFRQF